MLHRAWSSIVEVPYCFSRSYVKFEGHTALKIVEFDPNWAFPDCNSSLNSPMAMKCCTTLETAKEICPIVFQGHPSNFKVTRYKTSPILTQIGCFRTIGQSQLSNPSDLPCCFDNLLLGCLLLSMIMKSHTVTSKCCFVFVQDDYQIKHPHTWKYCLNIEKNIHGNMVLISTTTTKKKRHGNVVLILKRLYLEIRF